MTGFKVNREEAVMKETCRKMNKPLMERRRRERINGCLSQLKNLILEKMYKNESKVSKLEKADILEMTVQYLQSVQQKLTSTSELEMRRQYRAGFSKCATEVVQFLDNSNMDRNVRSSLGSHLNKYVRNIGVSTTDHANGYADCNVKERLNAANTATVLTVPEHNKHPVESRGLHVPVRPMDYSKKTTNSNTCESILHQKPMCESLPAFKSRLYQTYFNETPEESLNVFNNETDGNIPKSNSDSDSNVWRPW